MGLPGPAEEKLRLRAMEEGTGWSPRPLPASPWLPGTGHILEFLCQAPRDPGAPPPRRPPLLSPPQSLAWPGTGPHTHCAPGQAGQGWTTVSSLPPVTCSLPWGSGDNGWLKLPRPDPRPGLAASGAGRPPGLCGPLCGPGRRSAASAASHQIPQPQARSSGPGKSRAREPCCGRPDHRADWASLGLTTCLQLLLG